MGISNIEAVAVIQKDESERPESIPIQQLRDFYGVFSRDCEAWSPGFNMHCGFYRAGMNPFHREGMLEQLTREVLMRLRLGVTEGTVLDLGCGLGSSMRTAALSYPAKRFLGVTVCSAQTAEGNRYNTIKGPALPPISITADYTALPFSDNSLDCAFAIESIIYAPGSGKKDLVREAGRVLKAGGRIAIAEPMLKNEDVPMGWLGRTLIRRMARGWAATELPQVEHLIAALKVHGFEDIVAEDISWRVGPSVAHIPFVVLRFALRSFLRERTLSRTSRNHLLSSLLAIFAGCYRRKIRYYIVSATRK